MVKEKEWECGSGERGKQKTEPNRALAGFQGPTEKKLSKQSSSDLEYRAVL